ncbi:hypothetical protein EJ05DRAFT_480155 [Pseudovirgaria hyperparasitica]|uniref:Uncharacterized protein n=1 Tax=Pseudovirgaria hyperparasitica TaxID=470096 RepID=A0A6A6VWR6_9PEZI|nr:uncharacterized protein EJ05DRAFT_480155 [Pseudovirgaria hyperparasitica]KAF2753681.1 hypothetical protein EJ05DRAFT_480155 [Pseudovirgaria hyperparasitica]
MPNLTTFQQIFLLYLRRWTFLTWHNIAHIFNTHFAHTLPPAYLAAYFRVLGETGASCFRAVCFSHDARLQYHYVLEQAEEVRRKHGLPMARGLPDADVDVADSVDGWSTHAASASSSSPAALPLPPPPSSPKQQPGLLAHVDWQDLVLRGIYSDDFKADQAWGHWTWRNFRRATTTETTATGRRQNYVGVADLYLGDFFREPVPEWWQERKRAAESSLGVRAVRDRMAMMVVQTAGKGVESVRRRTWLFGAQRGEIAEE